MPQATMHHRRLHPGALAVAIACAGLMSAFSAMAVEESRPAPAAKAPARPAPPPAARPSVPPAGARPPAETHPGAPAGGHFNAGSHTQVQHYAFHEHDVRRFSEQDRVAWQGGNWHHEYHNGQFGYWWFAGGSWYFYDNPVYPYPLVVSDTVYVDPDVVDADAPAPDALTPPPGYWYWCDNPAGYYPYVSSCPTQFRPVPAQPPQ